MASEAQVLANRLNAQKSTGPRTVEGKAVVAQNAVKHGLLAREVVIHGEDPGEFEFYREQMLGELAPAGAVESMLAERAVGLAWRLRRAERVQAEVFDALIDKEMTDPMRGIVRALRRRGAKQDEAPGDSRDLTLGRVAARDFGHSRTLDRLGMYERRIEHSLYKTMNELQKLRLLRELNPQAPESAPEPVRPAIEERPCETKPISRDPNTDNPDTEATSGADKGRSCLTRGSDWGMIPHLEGPAGRNAGPGGSAGRGISGQREATEMAYKRPDRPARGLNPERWQRRNNGN